MKIKSSLGKYSSAKARWAGLGPYYAMFPTDFADAVVRQYTQIGDTVIDPFAGRGTAIFSAAVQERHGIGIDINPLGYVYGKTKIDPGSRQDVLDRLQFIQDISPQYTEEAEQLPPFFHAAYHSRVRQFLLAARSNLDWHHMPADRTLMAMILVSLHGKSEAALSNHMRQTTAMAPDYCIRWWQDRGLHPPDIFPVEFLSKRINWRYSKGVPQVAQSAFYLGDSSRKLLELREEVDAGKHHKAKLLLTSPPYHDVTNYYYDQWIRLWLLGSPPQPAAVPETFGGKFSNLDNYRTMLLSIFNSARPMLLDDAVIYVRTGKQRTTLETTIATLQEAFPNKSVCLKARPIREDRKTAPYGRGGAPRSPTCEVDVILAPLELG